MFYRRFGAPDPDRAVDLAHRAIEEFRRDLTNWVRDAPSSKEQAKGRPQKEPSQDRVHIIIELEQLARFCLTNSDVCKAGRWLRSDLKGRLRLSHYAVSALTSNRLVGLSIMEPVRSGRDRGTRERSAGINVWGRTDHGVDRRVLKRASASLAHDDAVAMRVLPAFGSVPAGLSEFFRTLPFDSEGHVAIKDFLARLPPTLVGALGVRSAAAAQSLRASFDISDNMRSAGRNLSLTSFVEPAPIYSFVKRLLSAGWPWSEDHGEQIRLFDGKKRRLQIEARFAALCVDAVGLFNEIVAPRRSIASNIFVGVKTGDIIADYNIVESDKGLYQDDIVKRIATSVIRHREQIVVLRDHVGLLEQWLLKRFDEAWPKQSDDLDVINADGFYALLDWCRECEAQYDEGVFYSFDRSRRDGGAAGELRRLPVDELHRRYNTETLTGFQRSAVGSVKAIWPIFEALYRNNPALLKRLETALERVLE